jgi:hypothetical protein
MKPKLNIKEVMLMPKTSKERQNLEQVITRVNAIVRGHVARMKFKRLHFLYLVTGKKAH